MAEYIEREAVKEVIKQLSREPAYQHDGEDYYMGVCAVDGEIAMLPTADVVEVRHGEWEILLTAIIDTMPMVSVYAPS